MLRNILDLATVLATSAVSAQAETLTLTSPLSGGTLQTHSIDMTAYWVPSDEAFEVVAYYAPSYDVSEVAKLQMRLADGDETTFSLPGFRGTVYNFKRTGDALSITSVPTAVQFAMTN